MATKGKKLTRQEELLLQDFSRNVSTKSSALFYGNAFIVSAIPICEYRIRNGNIRESLIQYSHSDFAEKNRHSCCVTATG